MKKYFARDSELQRGVKRALNQHDRHGVGLAALVVSLFILSFVAGLQPQVKPKIFTVGEVADSDIVAHRTLTVEDKQASEGRRNQVAMLQPTVFDLSVAGMAELREKVFHVLEEVNQAEFENGADAVAEKFATELGTHLSREMLVQWASPELQAFILNNALPWFDKQLREGVLVDARTALAARNGILIRDMDTGVETLRTEVSDIKDLTSLLVAFGQWLRTAENLSPMARRSVYALFSPLVMPTLTLNREATLSLGAAVAETVEPVFYQIQQGEVVVYAGERITREKQLKLQSLYRQQDGPIQARTVAGLFTLSLLISIGLFMAPSGKPGTPLRRKDFYFISLLLLGAGLGAKGAFVLIGRLALFQEVNLFMYAFPMAGAAGLCALIFAARRYCVVGLLLALFGSAMFKASTPLFLFFFLSAMLNTWLVIRAQNRQDAVKGVFPLGLGLCCIALGCGWLEGFRGARIFLMLGGLAFLNAFISLVVLFAVSPIIEMAFRYTTRFRLMELMNLEQPLLQELMVSVPGTYHHSLVVANMVEAGAKAVGANSLLCKVAALYHDVGKLAYPDYFIENQFNGPNRHDKLAPTMSALILGSHVKKGTELAAQHHVGDEIEDIIRQHHGTGLIRFFYNKAKELGENPRIEDYCYPGPRPQTREAAIVMLADAVEASSRTLSDPTPARIKNHIDTIMKGIFADGQLDESELTFKDLHKLAESFGRILTGLFHQRIAYPDVSKKSAETGDRQLPGKSEKNEKAEKTDKAPAAVKAMPAEARNGAEQGAPAAAPTQTPGAGSA